MTNKIKKMRKEKNVTVKEIIALIGISKCNYYKKELGQIRFSLDEAHILSKLFDKTIEELFFDKSDSKMERTA